LSGNDIKFEVFADDFLTVEQRRACATLQPFIRGGLPETIPLLEAALRNFTADQSVAG